MEPLSPREMKSIVDSFKRVFGNDNIGYLTKGAYKFIMLSSGFIAHYNIHGFRQNYKNIYYFASDIIRWKEANRWTNFRPGDKDYEYYKQKAEIYSFIADMAYSYLTSAQNNS